MGRIAAKTPLRHALALAVMALVAACFLCCASWGACAQAAEADASETADAAASEAADAAGANEAVGAAANETASANEVADAAAMLPQSRTVVVGHINMQGFLYRAEDGSHSGLAYDYLCEIAARNNWDLEFYECGYSQVEELFAAGTIDLFVPYQRTAEREELFEYSSEVLCTNRASILALPQSDIDYNDFAALDGCTVGELSGTRNGERFGDYLAAYGCTISVDSSFVGRDDLVAAAKDGAIDAFISASNRGISDFKIVCELPQTSSYVIGPKGDRSLLDALDAAIQAISIEMPGLMPSLEEKYQSAQEGLYPSLSEDEKSYIAEKKSVTVLVSTAECDASGNFSLSAKTFFDQMSALTGLEFVPVPRTSSEQIMQDIAAGKADAVFSFSSDYDWAQLHNVWKTSDYASFTCATVTRASNKELQKVAVVPGTYIAYWVERNTDLATVECDSYLDCVRAVAAGEVDVTYCTSPIANYYATFSEFRTLSFTSAYDFVMGSCLGVSKYGSQLLASILNKAILCIPDGLLNEAFEAQIETRAYTVEDLYYSNPGLFVLLVVGVVVLLLTVVFMLFYVRHDRIKNRKLAAATNAKTEFYSRMSHDMRTPMNGIIGITELAVDERDPDVLRDYMTKIQASGAYLLGLINDALDLQRVESGKLKLDPQVVATRDLVTAGADMVRLAAQEKGVDFRIVSKNANLDSYVLVDAMRIKQVFANLLSNAVKFTPAGGSVTIEFEVLERTGNTVHDRITVRDTGIGMSEQFMQEGLFKPFSQEYNEATATYAGTGLGLSIVKSILDRMGATIAVQSEKGKGTTFVVDISFECVERDEALHNQESKDVRHNDAILNLTGKNILLVEDNALNAEIAQKLLQKAGCTVTWAQNGQVCCDTFGQTPEGNFDAILMDVRMPVMGGIETTRAIRAMDRPDARRIPIIAMTANAYPEDVKSVLDAGMDDHLAKPVNPEKLYETLGRRIAERER